MKRYYIKEQTPLAFHKFVWYVSMPLGMLSALGQFYISIKGIVTLSWLSFIDALYFATVFLLLLITFIGFFKWKSYAWYGFRSFLFVGFAYNIFGICVYQAYLPNLVGPAVGQWVVFTVYAILVGIYYEKRKPLFFPSMIEDYLAENGAMTYYSTENEIKTETPPEKFCYSCGSKLLEDSEFCDQCGAKQG